jgi:hypothetical protein
MLEKRLLVKQAEALHAQRERDEAHALVQVTKRLDAHCCFVKRMYLQST